MSDLGELDAVGLADAIVSGAISAEAAVSAAIARAKLFAGLNAFVAIEEDRALEVAAACDRARAAGRLLGPLHGVPVAHKDMFYRRVRVSGCGSRIRQSHAAERDNPLLLQLDAAGAIDIGRLHMAEFAMGPTGHNAHLGRCRNPWMTDAISGGSSSGSGAAVGARIVPVALGSDTGGSVRLPAAFCGAAGLKPTQYRLPGEAMMPLSESLDTVGPVARSSRDVARVMAVLTGEPFEAGLGERLADLTIGVPTSYYVEQLEAPVSAALEQARRQFAELGAQVVDVAIPDHQDHAALAGLIWAPEAAALHLPWLRDRSGDYSEQVRNRLLHGLSIPATSYIRARQLRSLHLREMLDGPLVRCDMLLTPICRTGVPLADDVNSQGGPDLDRVISDISALTRTVSYLGLPALTTPMGFDPRGLPIGLQLIGRPNDEATLIRAGHAFERATDWLARPLSPPPPLNDRRSA